MSVQRLPNRTLLACSLPALTLFLPACASSGRTFATPQDAMRAVAEVSGTGDKQRIDEIFGSGATEVLWSGDPVADREDGARVRDMILERIEFTESEAGETVAIVDADAWPFPIPLVPVSATAERAATMTLYDPDGTWQPTFD
jgi:hypothetical protein